MTSTEQLLTLGTLYTGYVTKIMNAVWSKPYDGSISYAHRVFIRFDAFPDQDIECSYMNKIKDSDIYSTGEYVRVLPKNFSHNNYGIQKDQSFMVAPSTENEVMEAAEFLYSKNDTAAGVDMINYMMHSAIMGAATFCQYRMDCDKAEFYQMIQEIFTMQKYQEFKQPQK